MNLDKIHEKNIEKLFSRNSKNDVSSKDPIINDIENKGWPEDKIELSNPEYSIKDGSINLNLDKLKYDDSSDISKKMKFADAVGQWMSLHEEYSRKLDGFVRKELNIPEDHGYAYGGAGMALVEKIGQKYGLTRPVMPESLKEQGVVDPYENPDPNYGKFMIGKLGNGGFTDTIELAFNGKGVASNLLSELKATEAKDKGLARLKSVLDAGKSDSVWAHYVDSPALKDGKARIASVTIEQDGPLAGVIVTSGRYQNSTATGLELFRKIAGFMAG